MDLPSDIAFFVTGIPAYVARHMEKEMAVITGAPVAFCAASLFVGLIMWRFFTYVHKERLLARDEDIARLKDRLAKTEEDLKRAGEQNMILLKHIDD